MTLLLTKFPAVTGLDGNENADHTLIVNSLLFSLACQEDRFIGYTRLSLASVIICRFASNDHLPAVFTDSEQTKPKHSQSTS
jgi:hypothetical protein